MMPKAQFFMVTPRPLSRTKTFLDFNPSLSARSLAPTKASLNINGVVLEAWGQGCNVGSLAILILIVLYNYRSGILLHRLILLELVLAIWHGTFIFCKDPEYGWYLSATATLLFISYQLHNVVSWLKIRSFLPVWGSRLFIFSLLCVQPYWIVEAWSNFAYFNSLGSNANMQTRPLEAVFRDPWWIFTTWKLLNTITKSYGFKLWQLININRRFAVMLMCMLLSILFLLADLVVTAAKVSVDNGINPYWRFALLFKCASDTIILDDFKTVLDDIRDHRFQSQSNGAVHCRRKSRMAGLDRQTFLFVSKGPGHSTLDDTGPLSRPQNHARLFPLPSAFRSGWPFPSSIVRPSRHNHSPMPDRVLLRVKGDEGGNVVGRMV